MFEIAITGPGGERVFAALHELTIGRVEGNDVVLPAENVSRRHARFVAREGKIIVVDLKSTNGTLVNGRRIVSPLIVGPGDQIRIGDFTLVARFDEAGKTLVGPAPFVPRDDTEAMLLAQVDSNEPGSRVVYADWLEQRGNATEAEFVRDQDALIDQRTTVDEVRSHVANVGYRWRLRLARPPIEACSVAFELACPKEWGALSRTGRDDVRFCGACGKPVYYCATVDEAREHAANSECVALDLRPRRVVNDLAPPYGEPCGKCKHVQGDISATTCGKCGMRLGQAVMRVGRLALR